jgi:hypothetical protein
MLKTEIITFNVKNRGRKHRGSDRNFDTAALANLINSGAVQERVKNGDLHGYYGHWPREKFGMQPPEGAVVDGRQVEIIPALVTTLLQADPDGTIRHQAKFLDTPAGQLAARLYKSKTGGFSSAINSRRVGGMSVPTGFFGFDYVLEPNFTGNRGYEITLDSAGQPEVSEFDAVEEYNQSIIATNALFDSIQSQFDAVSSLNEQLLATNQRLVEENEALVSMLARAKPVEANLDAVQPYHYGGGENRLDSAESAFLSAGKLPAVVPAEEDKKPEYGGEAKGFLRRALGF